MTTVRIGQQTVPLVSDHYDQATLQKVQQFGPFATWLHAFDKEQQASNEFNIEAVDIQSIDYFAGNIGFIKFKAKVAFHNGKPAPGIVFMRGGAVSMLIVLVNKDDPADDDKIILTLQPRLAVPSFNFPELPAGMLDASGDFAGAASREIQEETGLTVQASELIDLTAKAYGDQWRGAYPSAGGSDEFLRLFVCRKEMAGTEIASLQGKLTGLRDEGEQITLKIVPLKDAWQHSPDMKLLSSLFLYNALYPKQ
ncbi:hypothetical protein DM01DRAFT_1405322 [Hesseltinella vesiculosa]|uniref:Nudix hydrolase domain-containing protein n=1 Tax=Hesseltinella vesiculosa TaxID=101127 RepID=A0A1X2GPK3_9FUNG|nr:hypothetical protein DM01DRAFT_1405322 [Hesseltinella vesiculosa]